MCPYCGNNDPAKMAAITYYTRRPIDSKFLAEVKTVKHCDKCGKEWEYGNGQSRRTEGTPEANRRTG